MSKLPAVHNCFLRSLVKKGFEQVKPEGFGKDHPSLNNNGLALQIHR